MADDIVSFWFESPLFARRRYLLDRTGPGFNSFDVECTPQQLLVAISKKDALRRGTLSPFGLMRAVAYLREHNPDIPDKAVRGTAKQMSQLEQYFPMLAELGIVYCHHSRESNLEFDVEQFAKFCTLADFKAAFQGKEIREIVAFFYPRLASHSNNDLCYRTGLLDGLCTLAALDSRKEAESFLRDLAQPASRAPWTEVEVFQDYTGREKEAPIRSIVKRFFVERLIKEGKAVCCKNCGCADGDLILTKGAPVMIKSRFAFRDSEGLFGCRGQLHVIEELVDKYELDFTFHRLGQEHPLYAEEESRKRLVLNHKNGRPVDDSIDNLELLCFQCDAETSYLFCGNYKEDPQAIRKCNEGKCVACKRYVNYREKDHEWRRCLGGATRAICRDCHASTANHGMKAWRFQAKQLDCTQQFLNWCEKNKSKVQEKVRGKK